MKKLFAFLLTLALVLGAVSSLAEEVTVLSSPDMEMPVYDGTLDNMIIGKGIDLGDRIYLPANGEIVDCVYHDPASKPYRFKTDSGKDAEFVLFELDVTNMSPETQMYFRECEVTVTYTNERGEYVYGGAVRQGTELGAYPNDQEHFTSIDPLYHGYYAFYCLVPNFVRDTAGRIVMNITVGDTVMTYVAREQ